MSPASQPGCGDAGHLSDGSRPVQRRDRWVHRRRRRLRHQAVPIGRAESANLGHPAARRVEHLARIVRGQVIVVIDEVEAFGDPRAGARSNSRPRSSTSCGCLVASRGRVLSKADIIRERLEDRPRRRPGAGRDVRQSPAHQTRRRRRRADSHRAWSWLRAWTTVDVLRRAVSDMSLRTKLILLFGALSASLVLGAASTASTASYESLIAQVDERLVVGGRGSRRDDAEFGDRPRDTSWRHRGRIDVAARRYGRGVAPERACRRRPTRSRRFPTTCAAIGPDTDHGGFASTAAGSTASR